MAWRNFCGALEYGRVPPMAGGGKIKGFGAPPTPPLTLQACVVWSYVRCHRPCSGFPLSVCWWGWTGRVHYFPSSKPQASVAFCLKWVNYVLVIGLAFKQFGPELEDPVSESGSTYKTIYYLRSREFLCN
ncbi:unnamed protein product [Prunus armeniaca]|uniref:Uncharacterized protein n=1 Tax=Prunus armeniaca TaxID=36596 RepID=A0A6J5TE50_PRUAR|nr:unnamed protein product [Prunus armeniaca]